MFCGKNKSKRTSTSHVRDGNKDTLFGHSGGGGAALSLIGNVSGHHRQNGRRRLLGGMDRHGHHIIIISGNEWKKIEELKVGGEE